VQAIDTLLSEIRAMTPLQKLRVASQLLEEALELDSPRLAAMSATIAAEAAQQVMAQVHAETLQSSLPCRSSGRGSLCANCLSSGRRCQGLAS
jgi:hypothetical protein